MSDEGVSQGGSISPLLANVVLNELDQKLDEWGYCYVGMQMIVRHEGMSK